jgi:hypothetical protein
MNFSLNLQNLFLVLLASTSTHGYKLSCQYSNVDYVGLYGELLHDTCYYCEATVDYICDESIDSIMGASKDHQPGRTDKDVLYLGFINQLIQTIPKNMGHFYPNLEIFKCMGGALTKVEKNDFVGIPKLKCLFLGRNDIEHLP